MTPRQVFTPEQQAALEPFRLLVERLAAACLYNQLRMARLELILKAHHISTEQEMEVLDRATTWQWQTGRMADAPLGPDIGELLDEVRQRLHGGESA